MSQSFWVNFALLFFVLQFGRRFTLPPYLWEMWQVFSATIGFFIVVCFVVYPWQVIGVIRACERCIKNRLHRPWAVAAEWVVVLSIIVTISMTFSTYQSLLGYQRNLQAVDSPVSERAYQLNLIRGNTLIHLRGSLEVGITHAVAQLLIKHPQISGIILDSDGGQIYEGRGLARLIKKNALATHSNKQCLSACTIAFIAGSQRTLQRNARLGFHQYKSDSVLPVFDIAEEQAKDRVLFAQQGISAAFLHKVFVQPPNKMWFPKIVELHESGVIHGGVLGDD